MQVVDGSNSVVVGPDSAAGVSFLLIAGLVLGLTSSIANRKTEVVGADDEMAKLGECNVPKNLDMILPDIDVNNTTFVSDLALPNTLLSTAPPTEKVTEEILEMERKMEKALEDTGFGSDLIGLKEASKKPNEKKEKDLKKEQMDAKLKSVEDIKKAAIAKDRKEQEERKIKEKQEKEKLLEAQKKQLQKKLKRKN